MSDPVIVPTFEVHLPEEWLIRSRLVGRRMIRELAPEPSAVEVHLPESCPEGQQSQWFEENRIRFEREKQAFFRLLPELLTAHRGQYVAICEGQVVDSGSDRLELVLRVQAKVRTGIYVGRVSDEPEPICRSGIRRIPDERVPIVRFYLHRSSRH